MHIYNKYLLEVFFIGGFLTELCLYMTTTNWSNFTTKTKNVLASDQA